ncbi:MAG: energy transducer TonB [Pseudolabrys sp.]
MFRWGACLALAVGLHAGGAAALLARWHEDSDLVANAPVIMLELAPVAAAPETTPTEVPPDTVQSAESEPEMEPEPEKPVEKVELPPEPEKPVEKIEIQPEPPAPEPQLAMLPPPKPVIERPKEDKAKQKKHSIARAAATADQRAEQAAAPAAGAASNNPFALPSWKSQLVSQLERHKRYPSDARGDQGVAQLAFSIDRQGGVHNARIVRSSGSSALDAATLALVARAAPLPPPPPEVPGPQIAIVVPIRYHAR